MNQLPLGSGLGEWMGWGEAGTCQQPEPWTGFSSCGSIPWGI